MRAVDTLATRYPPPGGAGTLGWEPWGSKGARGGTLQLKILNLGPVRGQGVGILEQQGVETLEQQGVGALGAGERR